MVTSREIAGNRFASRIERYARWVKQMKYTAGVALLLRIPFGRNKRVYRCSVNLAPSLPHVCMRVHSVGCPHSNLYLKVVELQLVTEHMSG